MEWRQCASNDSSLRFNLDNGNDSSLRVNLDIGNDSSLRVNLDNDYIGMHKDIK